MNKPTVNRQGATSPKHMRIYSVLEPAGVQQHMPIFNQNCTICGGAGRLRVAVPYGDPAFGRSTPCSCSEARQTSQRLQQRRQAANLDHLHQYTFTMFNDRLPGVQEARRVSAEFALNPRGWLLLMGPCGCGKTHLAAAVANQRLESGTAVFYTTTPDLLDALRAALSSPEQYGRLFSRVREVDLLVIDDLGAQQSSAWSNEKLSQILEVRAQKALTTVITAIPKEFQALNERLRSRLTDAQLVTTVLLEHTRDFRLHKRAPGRRMPG